MVMHLIGPRGLLASALLLLSVLLPQPAAAQETEFSLDLSVSDGIVSRLLSVGADSAATDDFDVAFDRLAPPPPPAGAFDTRLRGTDGGVPTDYYRDVRAAARDIVHQHWLTYAPGSGASPIVLSWDVADLLPGWTYTLVDEPGTPDVVVDLRSGGTLDTGAYDETQDPDCAPPPGGNPSECIRNGAFLLVTPPSWSAVGSSGWRLLSVPVVGMTVQDFVDLSLVQGIPGEFESAACGATNLFVGYNGDNADGTDPDGDGFCNDNGFMPPRDTDMDGSAKDEAVEPGRGVLWYLWSDAFDPDPDDINGESESAGLPLALTADGTPISGNAEVTFDSEDRASGADNFFFIGNPYSVPYDLSGISATNAGGAVPLSSTFQTYDPNGSTWEDVIEVGADNSATDDVAVWQGFFAQTTAAPSLPVTFTFDAAYKASSAPPFYGRTAGHRLVARGQGERRIAFTLAGETAYGPTLDRAATVRFVPDAASGWDRHDASKLLPFTSTVGLLAFVGSYGEDPSPDIVRRTEQAVRSLPYELLGSGGYDVPLAFFASREGTFTLTWEVEGLPATWELRLADAVTGEAVDLRTATSYAFSAAAMTDWEDRFTLSVRPEVGSAAASAGFPGEYALSAVAPNPTSGRARFTLRLAEGQGVRVALYDVLGREVALLHDGPLVAGDAHAFEVDGRGLAAGLYVLRADGETFVGARSFTLMR